MQGYGGLSKPLEVIVDNWYHYFPEDFIKGKWVSKIADKGSKGDELENMKLQWSIESADHHRCTLFPLQDNGYCICGHLNRNL